jgi:hypothetical protein
MAVFDNYYSYLSNYKSNPTSNNSARVRNEVIRLIKSGWLTPNLRAVYDLDLERFRCVRTDNSKIVVYDQTRTIQTILKHQFDTFTSIDDFLYIPISNI